MLKKMTLIIIFIIAIFTLCACAESNTNENNKTNAEILQSFLDDPDIDNPKTLTLADEKFMEALENAFYDLNGEQSDVMSHIVEATKEAAEEGHLTKRDFYSMIGLMVNIINTTDKTHETIENAVISSLDRIVSELKSDGMLDEEIAAFESLRTLYLAGKENTYNDFENPKDAVERYLQSIDENNKITIVDYGNNNIAAFIYNDYGAGHLIINSRQVEDKIYYSITSAAISCEFSRVDAQGIVHHTFDSIPYGLADMSKKSDIPDTMNIIEIQRNGEIYFFFYQPPDSVFFPLSNYNIWIIVGAVILFASILLIIVTVRRRKKKAPQQ